MPETYTVTASDVASVDSASTLTTGVVFDWTSQTITVPSSVNGVSGQWAVDNARFAEATTIGTARPKIIDATGNVQIGTDPSTNQPIVTGVLGILLDGWKVVSLKGTGEEFTIRDIYKTDASLPYDSNTEADVIYRQTINPTVVFVTVEGSTFTLEDIWTYSTRTLTDDTDRVKEVHRLQGLDASNPVSITDTARTAGDITQAIADDGTTTTVTRT